MTKHSVQIQCMINPSRPLFKQGESALKTLRKLLGDISQEEFARRIGVSGHTVSRWERGVWNATLTLPQIKSLEKELNSIGLTFQDLPDTFEPLPRESATEN